MQRRQQIKQQHDNNNSTNANVYKTLRRLWQNLQHHHQDELQKLADKHQEGLWQRKHYDDRITHLETKVQNL